ncbi:hypothetical protein [Pleurocapsa sp. FMAR1]|uniref:hypothetical protein n=1 Tax=Pleurocapsa sp. FMAR1 TaxID=3040204 RepID=UPI0029C92A41|nr:hypothetical protein [Pleurocapsa sp. FMAR1]
MKRIILLVLLLLSACQAKTINTQSEDASSTESGVKISQVNTATIKEKVLISSSGIGKAKLGMTLGQLKQISDPDTKFEMISSFTVDTNAIAVTKKDIVQYYILYPVETTSDSNKATPNDDDPITMLLTDNDRYQTKAGIKAGMPIKEAEKTYGNAVLAYNTEGESSEYVTFEDQKPENIRFRASNFELTADGTELSGIYADYPGVSYVTDKYRDDAAIAAIEVSCDPENCP